MGNFGPHKLSPHNYDPVTEGIKEGSILCSNKTSSNSVFEVGSGPMYGSACLCTSVPLIHLHV